MSENSKIIRLEASNVKRLRAVEITPEGNLVVIGGKNAQGKTSVLDSIEYAMNGKGSMPSRPVRDGEDKAKVVCDLGDLVVTRTMTAAGGGALTVTNKEGAKYPSPQKMLDGLVGKLSFDPLEFSRMRATDQVATLKDLAKLDFSELDDKRSELVEERSGVNFEGKRRKSVLQEIDTDGLPEEEIDVGELAGQIEEIGERNLSRHDIERERDGIQNEVAQEKINSSQLKDNIEGLQQELSDLVTFLDDRETNIVKLLKELDNLPEAKPQEDSSPILEEMKEAQEINARLAEALAVETEKNEISKLRERSVALSGEIKGIDQEKRAAMEAAEFPVAGLGFDGGVVTLDDIPFDQLSGAEQLRVSLAMGLAANPKLRVILIRDGSLLDSDNLEIVREMADKHDAQIWIERVGSDESTSIIIEDGEVS